jgi:hypothetical protein
MPFTKEDVEILAYRRYKSKESYERSIWYLAELCCIINKNVKNAEHVKPLETDNLILLLSDDVNGNIIMPTTEEITDLAEIIYHEHPESSKLHWFIAEKTLLLEEIKQLLNRKN